MKRGILIGIVLCLCLGAVAPVSRYWQDVLRKPNQQWIETYGHREDSILAFNVRSLLEVQNRIAQELVALQAKVDALDPNAKPQPTNDPNEVVE